MTEMRLTRKMKLKNKEAAVYKDWIDIIPSIRIFTNDYRYLKKTFAIEFSWLIFHARLTWIESEAK